MEKPKLTLLGAEHSYFTAKARSYMRYKGKQGKFFQEAVASLDIYRNAILPLVGVSFIPVLLVHDGAGKIIHAIQDTSLIIDYVERNYPGTHSIHPTTPKQRFLSYLVEVYADEWLKMPAMHYRWSFLEENREYLIYEWGLASTPSLPANQRREQVLNAKGKGATFSNMKGTLPLLGITEETGPEVERSFLNLLDILNKHFSVHKFLLGGRPCLGDFALIGPFYAHLFKDPKPSSIMRSKAPAFCAYIERMNGLRPSYETLFTVDSSKHVIPSPQGVAELGRVFADGDFLANDEIPDTLLPLIEIIFDEHIPVLLSTCRELADFLKSNSLPADQPLPRTTGYHSFRLGRAQASRLAYPYDIWMLQRCMDSIRLDKNQVFEYFQRFPNAKDLINNCDWINSELRLRIVNYKLYRDPTNPPQLVQSKL